MLLLQLYFLVSSKMQSLDLVQLDLRHSHPQGRLTYVWSKNFLLIPLLFMLDLGIPDHSQKFPRQMIWPEPQLPVRRYN